MRWSYYLRLRLEEKEILFEGEVSGFSVGYISFPLPVLHASRNYTSQRKSTQELLDIAILDVTIEEIKEMHEIAKTVYSEKGEQRLVLR